MITRRHLLRSLAATAAAIAMAPAAGFAGIFRSGPPSITIRGGEVHLDQPHYRRVTILGGVCITKTSTVIDDLDIAGGTFIAEFEGGCRITRVWNQSLEDHAIMRRFVNKKSFQP